VEEFILSVIEFRGTSPIMGRFPNLGKSIISYQKVLRSALKNVNQYSVEVIPCSHIINGLLFKTVKFLLIPQL
jgi:hypothetical protein